jgi:putative transposase
MPRTARLDAPGTLHHVIVRGIERRHIIDDNEDRKEFVERMGHLAVETKMVIYAWALLNNHAHILLRSSDYGLSHFMRRFLTGYAIRYNRRHLRHGHLFQNRFKSIVCEEDGYFRQLVCYIHLNPLRAKLVKDIKGLSRYRWCGHAVIMGNAKNEWQDRKYVLKWFGRKEKEAIRNYRNFVKKRIKEGQRLDLVGGGLIRSMGGWSEVISMRRFGERGLSDERILGSGEFVERMIGEANVRLKRQFTITERLSQAKAHIKKVCETESINRQELISGSRRRHIARVRSSLAVKLVEELGISLAETARQLGVSTSAISKIMRKYADNK